MDFRCRYSVCNLSGVTQFVLMCLSLILEFMYASPHGRHVDAFSQPGALTCAINYYRAMFRSLWNKSENSKEIVSRLRTIRYLRAFFFLRGYMQQLKISVSSSSKYYFLVGLDMEYESSSTKMASVFDECKRLGEVKVHASCSRIILSEP